MKQRLLKLKQEIDGDVFFDKTNLTIYSTDASVYKEKPLAAVMPKNHKDIKKLIDFAHRNKTSLIPRGAGTSLAGQVVGKGIIVDVSKYMNKIIQHDTEKKLVTVQPGVVLDELNKYLKKYELFFAPETSTANRCTIGGMLGNNACGLHSVAYGSTRDHTVRIKAILSNGEEAVFESLTKKEFENKCKKKTFEAGLYRNIKEVLSDKKLQKKIEQNYPEKKIPRRNNGYALDLLLDTEIFTDNNKSFNFCKLLAGSEGTLAFSTEITLNLLPLPPKHKAVIVAHCSKLEHAFHANLIALKYKPTAVELADNVILEMAKKNPALRRNSFFIKGEPEAILIIEFSRENENEITEIAKNMANEMRKSGYAYHFPIIKGKDIKKVWDLRKAGLGVLSNMKGDASPVCVIEDTAVSVENIPAYMNDFKNLLKKYNLKSIYYAHIGSGELHLRPVLNLKDKDHIKLFRTFAYQTAKLVKKYRGSLSGEHGDGRLRGEFIPFMYGNEIYETFRKLKKTWDKNYIFNPGKITDTPAMNEHLRYTPGQKTPVFNTIFDFSNTDGYMRAIEKCTGSADCRKSEIIGGTMCPSYMATREEKNSSRARANMLREIITNEKNPFENKELYEILNLCLSCKACKTECPANVDITKLKAEFMQFYFDKKGIPFRNKIVANISEINKLLSLAPALSNAFLKNKFFAKQTAKIIGFHNKRKLPKVNRPIAKKLRRISKNKIPNEKTVYLFIDEFTNYNDALLGTQTFQLLTKLGYNVIVPKHTESGRASFSKGLLRKAKKIAQKNLIMLKDLISEKTPLVGIEPSAILSFRDEYPDLFPKKINEKNETINLHNAAQNLKKNSFLIDEFIANEIKIGKINKSKFKTDTKKIMLHAHCQQKSIVGTDATKFILSFPENYTVEEIPSGCCGMAGSFGFEKEHYDISMKIGEMILFPAVRNTPDEVSIVANGTSCRHQIKEGTGKIAKHPVEILWKALK